MIHAIRPISVPRPVTALLGFIAGFVDICSFLGLFRTFVAQLTGSFVFASSWLVTHQGELLTALAIPTFFLAGCVAAGLAALQARRGRPLAWVAGLECALIAAMLVSMLTLPLDSANAPGTLAAALLGVAAMGVQSAMVRLFMRAVPSTNVLTSNTTHLAVDATLLLLSFGRHQASDAAIRQAREARERLGLFWPPMAGFVLGTAVGALCFALAGKAAIAVPLAGAFGFLIWCLRGAARLADA
ncbi:MAG: DUF1275 domain-containing protein [Xanthobacteraceae bacterium]|nr:DUF1275 domain-containing protein [Xanthobacteraceae bacterium]